MEKTAKGASRKQTREVEDGDQATRKKKREEVEEVDGEDIGRLVRRLHREVMERITDLEMTMDHRFATYDKRAEKRGDMTAKKTDRRMREMVTQVKMVRSRADIVLNILEKGQEKKEGAADEVDGDGVTDRGTPEREDSERSDDEAEATLRDAALETPEETGEKVDDGGEQSEEE